MAQRHLKYRCEQELFLQLQKEFVDQLKKTQELLSTAIRQHDDEQEMLAVRQHEEEQRILAILQHEDEQQMLAILQHEVEQQMLVIRQHEEELQMLAFSSIRKEQQKLAMRQHDEDVQMHTTAIGRAWKLVKDVLALDESIKQQRHQTTSAVASSNTMAAAADDDTNKASAIAKDDMVFLAANMFRQQDAFYSAGKPVHVDLGFHYTRPDNVSRIRTDGLLSKAEREGLGISSFYNGSVYGDGIYTSDDHSLGCFGDYGDIGIIVGKEKHVATVELWFVSSFARTRHTHPFLCSARLKGTDKNDVSFSGDHDCNQSLDSAITVLKTSAQCLALVEFHRSVLFPTATTAAVPAVTSGLIGEYHRGLQQIVDEAFNENTPGNAT